LLPTTCPDNEVGAASAAAVASFDEGDDDGALASNRWVNSGQLAMELLLLLMNWATCNFTGIAKPHHDCIFADRSRY
jgi:hypothetical protein